MVTLRRSRRAPSATEGALRNAAGTGEVLMVVYRGGSQPGTAREIVVRNLRRRGLVAVHDVASDRPRTYKLDLIEVVDHGTTAPAYDPDISAAHWARTRRGWFLSWFRSWWGGR